MLEVANHSADERETVEGATAVELEAKRGAGMTMPRAGTVGEAVVEP